MSPLTCIRYTWHDEEHNACVSPINCTNIETCREGYPCQTLYANTNKGLVWQVSGCALQKKCQIETYTDKCIMKHSTLNAYHCCCTVSECNRNVVINATHMKPRPTTTPTTPTYVTDIKPDHSNKVLYYILPPIFGFFILILVLICIWKRHQKAISNRNPLIADSPPPTPPLETKPINKQEIVSRGQFGCVWKAYYENKVVAVKVIQAHEKASWEAEKVMYSEYRLNHDNILHFISAEKRKEDGMITYWIVTEFHSHGSLADFLHATVLDLETLMKLTLSMVAGLSYLHANPSNNSYKPVISHRDFKSRNVLVKNDLACCISDFGSAFAFYPGVDNEEAKAQVGTKRYMAPEVLQGAIAFNAESFLCIDVYALALVMWELLSRCDETSAPVEAYRSPYEEEVGIHPAIEDMRRCVLENKTRPYLREEWRMHDKLREYCDTIEDCWDDDGDARLTAHCVYERLSKLSNNDNPYGQLQHPMDHDIESNGKLVIELSDQKAEFSYSSIASSRRTQDTTC